MGPLLKIFIPIFFFCQLADAYTLTQAGIRGFKLETISIHLNPSNCPVDIGIYLDDAIDFWNSAPRSGVHLQRAEDVGISMADALSFNFFVQVVVMCSTNMQGDVGTDSALGVGSSVDTNSDGHLDRGVLVINMDVSSGARFDIQPDGIKKTTVRHEIGHVLGLGHSSEEAALMFFSADQKEEANLHQDDIDGISHLYPQDELSGDYFFGCASIGLKKKPSNPSGSLALLLLPILLLLTLRFRRRETLPV